MQRTTQSGAQVIPRRKPRGKKPVERCGVPHESGVSQGVCTLPKGHTPRDRHACERPPGWIRWPQPVTKGRIIRYFGAGESEEWPAVILRVHDTVPPTVDLGVLTDRGYTVVLGVPFAAVETPGASRWAWPQR